MLALILLVVLGVNVFLVTGTSLAVNDRHEEIRPPKLNVTSIIDPDCADCFDLDPFLAYLEEANVEIASRSYEDFGGFGAGVLINQYDIKKIPALIITGEIDKDLNVKALFEDIGEIKFGAFVLTDVRPVYYDLEQEKYVGRFSVTFMDDASCLDCYDVSLHKNALEALEMTPAGQELIDVADDRGQELVEKYKIKFVPTIILGGELDGYDNFQSIWVTVGTAEEDGAYVFRHGVEQMGKYKVLETGEIIDPFSN